MKELTDDEKAWLSGDAAPMEWMRSVAKHLGFFFVYTRKNGEIECEPLVYDYSPETAGAIWDYTMEKRYVRETDEG